MKKTQIFAHPTQEILKIYRLFRKTKKEFAEGSNSLTGAPKTSNISHISKKNPRQLEFHKHYLVFATKLQNIPEKS